MSDGNHLTATSFLPALCFLLFVICGVCQCWSFLEPGWLPGEHARDTPEFYPLRDSSTLMASSQRTSTRIARNPTSTYRWRHARRQREVSAAGASGKRWMCTLDIWPTPPRHHATNKQPSKLGFLPFTLRRQTRAITTATDPRSVPPVASIYPLSPTHLPQSPPPIHSPSPAILTPDPRRIHLPLCHTVAYLNLPNA